LKKAPFEHTPRIEWKNGAWRYRPRNYEKHLFEGKSWYSIGKHERDVYRFLADQSKRDAGLITYITTVNQGLDRYATVVIPRKAYSTRKINMYAVNRLKQVFGKSHPLSIRFPDILKYRDLVGDKHGKKSANNDLELLSHFFSKLVEWGTIENAQHPMRGMKYKFSLPSRDRYVSHQEITTALSVANSLLRVYIPFKLKTGLDKSTLLRIKLTDITEDGIGYYRRKLKRWDSEKKPKKYLIPWDNELRILVSAAIDLHKKECSTNLFSTREGKAYIDENGGASAFNSIWQRFMRKALSETELKEKFTEHDLRAKNASDEVDEKIASKRLSHASQSMTDVYRRRPEQVKSMKMSDIGLSEMIQTLKNDTTE